MKDLKISRLETMEASSGVQFQESSRLNGFHHNQKETDIEPSMFVQRPSSGRSQDVSHTIVRIFRDLFTKDAVDQETVRNLTTSKSGKSGYHDRYVDKLDKVLIILY